MCTRILEDWTEDVQSQNEHITMLGIRSEIQRHLTFDIAGAKANLTFAAAGPKTMQLFRNSRFSPYPCSRSTQQIHSGFVSGELTTLGHCFFLFFIFIY